MSARRPGSAQRRLTLREIVDLHRPHQPDRKLLPCRISNPRSLNP